MLMCARARCSYLQVQAANGDWVTVMTFEECFPSHIRFMWMVASGLPMRLSRKPMFREFARGLEPRIVLPHRETVHRLAGVVDDLQVQHLRRTRANHIAAFKGLPCVGLQLDLWTDRNSGIAYAAVHASIVAESAAEDQKMQSPLQLIDELLHFCAFPYTKHTAQNICGWLVNVLEKEEIPATAVSGVTPDGAADGQAGCRLVEGLKMKVDVCQLHELQRCVLYAIGMAGSTVNCVNPDFKDIVKINKRMVQLTHQVREVSDAIRQFQEDSHIPGHKVLTTVRTNDTRWNNQKNQISRNNLLRPVFDPVMATYKREHPHDTAIVDINKEDSAYDSEGDLAAIPRGPYSLQANEVKRKDIGFKEESWNANLEAEAFLTRPAETKDILENNAYITGAQGVQLMVNLKKLNTPTRPLNIKLFPKSIALRDRDRTVHTVKPEDLTPMITKAREVIAHQIEKRFVQKVFSDARLIHIYMSKGVPAEKILSEDNLQRAKALYLKWLRNLVSAGCAGERTSPRKKGKSEALNLLDAMDDSDDETAFQPRGHATLEDDHGADRVRTEIVTWQELPAEIMKRHVGNNGLINEYSLMYDIRDSVPLHYKLFKQVASHRGNEANAENTFSLSGSLSNTNTHTQPGFLSTLVKINKNKALYNPKLKAVLGAYKTKYNKLPKLGDDVTDDDSSDHSNDEESE